MTRNRWKNYDSFMPVHLADGDPRRIQYVGGRALDFRVVPETGDAAACTTEDFRRALDGNILGCAMSMRWLGPGRHRRNVHMVARPTGGTMQIEAQVLPAATDPNAARRVYVVPEFEVSVGRHGIEPQYVGRMALSGLHASSVLQFDHEQMVDVARRLGFVRSGESWEGPEYLLRHSVADLYLSTTPELAGSQLNTAYWIE